MLENQTIQNNYLYYILCIQSFNQIQLYEYIFVFCVTKKTKQNNRFDLQWKISQNEIFFFVLVPSPIYICCHDFDWKF